MDWIEYPYSIENDKISLSVVFMWRDGRVVEGGGLENRFTSNRDGGSNPSPSVFYVDYS